jgi:hypothetical protein
MARRCRSWSDGRRVHLIVRFTGGQLGRVPVTMHGSTEIEPVRAVVRDHLAARGSDMAGDPVAVDALATRVGGFGLFRKIGRAASSAASFATAPVRALAGAGIESFKATTNVARGIESAAKLTTYVTKPLAWRPGGGKRSAPAAPAAPPDQAPAQSNPDEEEPMNDDTSGTPKPQAKHVHAAHRLLKRAQSNPDSARHVKNIAKAAAQGHPGARVAQAALQEAKKKNKPAALPPMPAASPPPVARRLFSPAFPAWAKGAL